MKWQMLYDYNDYFNRIFDIKKHNRYETVTLFNEDTPITLTVQEYKESL